MIYIDDEKKDLKMTGTMEDILYEYFEGGVAIKNHLMKEGIPEDSIMEIFDGIVEMIAIPDITWENLSAKPLKIKKGMVS